MIKTFFLALGFLILFLNPAPGFAAQAVEKAVYYCQMHPEVQSDQPGKCPVCKMGLIWGTPPSPAPPPPVLPLQPHTDHAPRHGGLLGMTEKHHPEYVYKPNGEHRIYLSDEFRNPINTKDVKGTLTIMYPGGSKEILELAHSPGGTYLLAASKRKIPKGTEVRMSLIVRGENFFMDFGVPDSMIDAKPDPVGWPALLTNVALILFSLTGLSIVIIRSRKTQPEPGRPAFRKRRLVATALVVVFSVALFYVANGMILPRIEEAQEAAKPAPPHLHATGTVSASDERIKLNAQTQAIIGIKVAPAAETVLHKSITALGKVTPRTGAVGEVFAPVAGRATAVGHIPSIGEWVTAGQSLVIVEQVLTVPEKTSLTSEEYRVEANITQAQNTMNQALADHQRAERLYALKAVALTDLQHAKLVYDNAKAAYEGALKQREVYKASQPGSQNSIARYPVRAPIGGVVTLAEAANGEYVSTSKRLFTIMDLSTVWIQAQVYEKDLADVLKTQKAAFSLDALPGETFEGRIKTVSPVVNETTRTVDVLFDAPNPKMKLRVGMAVKVSMQTGKAQPSLTIPASALLEDEGRPAVYVALGSDEFVRRDVQVGMRAQGRVEIKSGLTAGESVVVQGGYQLQSAAARATLPGGQTGDGHTGHSH